MELASQRSFPAAKRFEVTGVPMFELRVNGQFLLANGKIAADS